MTTIMYPSNVVRNGSEGRARHPWLAAARGTGDEGSPGGNATRAPWAVRVRSSAWVGCAALSLAWVGACGSPAIQSSLKHPDADKTITFNASRGHVKGDISQMEIVVGGAVCATAAGDTATCSGGPYPSFSNSKLHYEAIATKSDGKKVTKSGWVYIANPKGVYTYTAPSGSNDGYAEATAEQTGANLYRLDKGVVRTHAMNALLEYANATGQSVTTVANTADLMVAAVASYVDEHMSWRSDSENRDVFEANGWGSYAPGWDFPQPADLTLTISGSLENSSANDDFQGDCEDHAILRAALLRALGFAPWAIWDAIDKNITHEYNVVLYEGAYRLMDYGTIERWLDTHSWDAHESYYGWNEDYGPRGVATANHTYLETQTDNYPGGKSDGQPWSYQIYYKDTSP